MKFLSMFMMLLLAVGMAEEFPACKFSRLGLISQGGDLVLIGARDSVGRSVAQEQPTLKPGVLAKYMTEKNAIGIKWGDHQEGKTSSVWSHEVVAFDSSQIMNFNVGATTGDKYCCTVKATSPKVRGPKHFCDRFGCTSDSLVECFDISHEVKLSRPGFRGPVNSDMAIKEIILYWPEVAIKLPILEADGNWIKGFCTHRTVISLNSSHHELFHPVEKDFRVMVPKLAVDHRWNVSMYCGDKLLSKLIETKAPSVEHGTYIDVALGLSLLALAWVVGWKAMRRTRGAGEPAIQYVPGRAGQQSLALLTLFMTIGIAGACNTAFTISGKCTNSVCPVLQQMDLRAGQEACFRMSGGKSLLPLSVRVLHTGYTPVLTRQYYSHESQIEVLSQHHCDCVGGCVGTACEDIKPSTSMNYVTGNRMEGLGVSGCSSGCQGWTCGCLSPFHSCVFWAAKVKPLGEIFEVQSIDSWRKFVDLNVHHQGTDYKVRVFEAGIAKIGNMTIYVRQVFGTEPPRDRFLLSYSGGCKALVETGTTAGVMVAGELGEVQCVDAGGKCQFDPAMVTCLGDMHSVKCSFKTFRVPASCKLPLKGMASAYLPTKEAFEIVESEVTSVSMQFEGSFEMAETSDVSASIKEWKIEGCYSCREGARLVGTTLRNVEVRVHSLAASLNRVVFSGDDGVFEVAFHSSYPFVLTPVEFTVGKTVTRGMLSGTLTAPVLNLNGTDWFAVNNTNVDNTGLGLSFPHFSLEIGYWAKYMIIIAVLILLFIIIMKV